MSHRNCPGLKCSGFSSITALVSKCLGIGAEVSQSVLMRKCLVAEVSGNLVLPGCCMSRLQTASAWLFHDADEGSDL